MLIKLQATLCLRQLVLLLLLGRGKGLGFVVVCLKTGIAMILSILMASVDIDTSTAKKCTTLQL